jgi:hypothetical protein
VAFDGKWDGTYSRECADDGDAAGAGEGRVVGVVVLEDTEGEAKAWVYRQYVSSLLRH